MAQVTTFSTVKTAVADWLDRDDIDDAIDQFIQFAERRIYRGGRHILTNERIAPVRIRAMETALSVTIANGVAAVPADYLELRYVYVDTSAVVTLQQKPPAWIVERYPIRSSDGIPHFIARDGENFMFGPYPDSGYTIKGSYYQELTTLSTSNETNWFTTNAPDLLVYGALCESAGYVGNDERLALWEGRYEAAREAVQEQDEQERYSSEIAPTVVAS